VVYQGSISVNPRGFGFLTLEDGRAAFVTPPDLNRFLDGDIAEAQLQEGQGGRWQASHLQLLQRKRSELFGTVTRRRNQPFLKVDRTVSNTDWPLEQAEDLQEGEAWIARLEGDRLIALRPVEDPALERCLVRHGIRPQFSEDLLTEASQAKWTLTSERRDLRHIPTVTIDAPSTTDIDDALSALPAEADGAIRVLVSIADVDALVAHGSPLDREAELRATSVYLAGHVVPMFPEALSGGAASLLPGCDRPTLTAELRIGPEGEITSVDVYPSVICSHARLSYESVSQFLLTMDPGDIPLEVTPTLRRLRTAAARLGAQRAARGGVEMAREEAYISFDPATRQPTDLEPLDYTMSHCMVERLMVAANEAMARWLVERGLPGMFRVHDQPDSEQVEMLNHSARNFGIDAALGPQLSPRGLAAFEAQYLDTPVAPALRTVLGRILGPARYTPVPGLHFGLAAPLYLHFTSPIRRYADLAVHRIVKRYLGGDRSQASDSPSLQALAHHLNEAAWRASKAENERYRMLTAQIFAQRIGQRFLANVIMIKPFGLVLQMTGTGSTGTIASDLLPDGPYEYQPDVQAWVSEHQSFAVGDSLEVEIISVNEELGRIDLALAED